MRTTSVIAVLTVLMLILTGCSGAGLNPASPSSNPDLIQTGDETAAERVLWGIWNIGFDPGELTVTIQPARNLQAHFKITDWLLPPECDDCLKIKVNSFNPVTRILDADVTLRNPTLLNGYDVRGILYTNDYGHELRNADDWTQLFDIPGGDDINPFRAYAKEVPYRVFAPDSEHTDNYLMYIPIPPNFNAITFAVEASWPGNCFEPYQIYNQGTMGDLDEFGLVEVTINAYVGDWQSDVESVKLDVTPLGAPTIIDLVYESGDKWTIDISNQWGAPPNEYELWLIAKSINNPIFLYDKLHVTVFPGENSPPVWDDEEGIIMAVPGNEKVTVIYGTASDPHEPVTYVVYYDDTTPINHPTANKIMDSEGSPTIVDGLINYQDYYFSVRAMDAFGLEDSNTNEKVATPHPMNGWALTCGGNSGDGATGIVTDSSGNIYITGYFAGTADLDPDLVHEEIHTSPGSTSSFISKFDVNGNFQWAVSWGAEIGTTLTQDMAISESGFIYVTGDFSGSVDFDPGPGVEEHSSTGSGWGNFVSKFDPDGNFQWVVVFGDKGQYSTFGLAGITADGLSNAYITSYFCGTVDFDPGPGIEEHSANGNYDSYLVKFNSEGSFQWANTWGGEPDPAWPMGVSETGYGLALDNDDNIYVTGAFFGTADFDPGPGTEEHTSQGDFDAYLVKFTPDGDLGWVQTWNSAGMGVQIDNTGVFVAGMDYTFSELSKFYTDGSLDWQKTWGVTIDMAITTDVSGNIFVGGYFDDTKDFAPGPGIEERTSNGVYDAYISKFDSDGNLLWVNTWGGAGFDWLLDAVTNSTGDILSVGGFGETVDFFPGFGTDERISLGGWDILVYKLPPDGQW